MRTILIVDDKRSIKAACEEASFVPKPDDVLLLCRPFQVIGLAQVVASLIPPLDVITSNRRFDMWILDNDYGLDAYTRPVEGYTLLKQVMDEHPDLIPDVVLSCSGNYSRRRDIVEHHAGFIKYVREP